METLEPVLAELKNMAAKSEENKAALEEMVAQKINESLLKVKDLQEQQVELKSLVEEIEKKAGRMALAGQKQEAETKSFNTILAETIEANAEEIKSFKRGEGEKRIRLAGFDGDKVVETKAVGDMSIAANFPTSSGMTTDYRNVVIPNPYERTWLADVLPGGSSTATSIFYPKENGGEGGAALWTDKATDKAQMDFDLTGQNAYFKWIAGFVIVEREMLDDLAFMTSYIQNKMLISLKTAENAFILNGSADTNPVTGLLTAATAYNGTMTSAVDKIIDAAWGQIVEDTFEFYSPTHVVLRPRDAVKIGLNKATGSGEYDLPPGSVGYVNGQLTIGGLNTVRTTSIPADSFLALDARATMFIRRMQPELRMFEDSTLAKRNKIMFRIEERATLAIFNNAAIVDGDLGFAA